ncbi:NAD(+) diphosphatase [Methanolobus sp. WCC4]|uniref:NAD(+) diphosphatase n=1 Tax=Methanolobus sp. WCC4 TaxID=3125784 RepID=UPI0030F59C16
MSSQDIDLSSEFVPLVSPPQKEGTNETCCFAFRDRKLLLLDENDSLRLPSLEEAENMCLDILRKQYLGELRDVSCYSMELNGTEDSDMDVVSDDLSFFDIRRLADILEEPFVSLAGKAVHIMEWDRNTLFCGSCGSPTVLKAAERAKACPECGFTAFPKISPAIIVLIEKGDRLLLARSPHFPPGRYSIIAGFVEPGETIEQAVVREVMEEVGISVRNIRYFGSQPWPHPDSLMIGFTAEHSEGEIRIDGIEIEDAGWYTKDEIPHIPGTDSISGQLIHHFISKHS